MKQFFPFVLLSIVFCGGCAVFWELQNMEGRAVRELVEPLSLPAAPDMSTDFAEYRDIAVAYDPAPFSERLYATDMGEFGVPVNVGAVPLRRIAARGLKSLVDIHFRHPAGTELPAFVLETRPQFLSVKKDKGIARVRISVLVSCFRQNDNSSCLFSEKYDVERSSHWVSGTVPIALYDALNDIWEAFLRDFLRKPIQLSVADKPASPGKTPELLTFFFEPNCGKNSVVVGSCKVACNGCEAFDTAAWAKQRIYELCVAHLGIEQERVRIRYNDERTKFDKESKTWQFVFSTWARTRMILEYDPGLRKGIAIVDLGLFNDTAENAANAAKQYIAREADLRSGPFSNDAPGSKADIDFLTIETDAENNLLLVPFKVLY